MKIQLFQTCQQNLLELNILCSSSPSQPPPLNPLYQPSSFPLASTYTSPLDHIPPNLVSLSLYRPNISSPMQLIEALTNTTRHLTQLSLFCVECLTDASLAQLIELMGARLRLFHVGGYMALANRLSDVALAPMARVCHSLESVSFEMFSHTAHFESLRPIFENEQRARKFAHINLNACRALSQSLLGILYIYEHKHTNVFLKKMRKALGLLAESQTFFLI